MPDTVDGMFADSLIIFCFCLLAASKTPSGEVSARDMPAGFACRKYLQSVALQQDVANECIGDLPVIVRNLGFLEGDPRNFVFPKGRKRCFWGRNFELDIMQFTNSERKIFLHKCLWRNWLQTVVLKMRKYYEKSVDIEWFIMLKNSIS